jgi:Flp pilus assembly secretin CpaC
LSVVKASCIRILCVMLLMRMAAPAAAKPFEIEEMEFKGSRVMDIIRVLSVDSKVNIIATPEAGNKEVTIFLKRVNLEEAIKAICRVSGLWYRRDEGYNGTYRLMTKEQYSKDLVIGQDDTIRVFQLRNPNVIAVASAIEDLYGDRVQVSYGNSMMGGIFGNMMGGGFGNGSNRTGRGGGFGAGANRMRGSGGFGNNRGRNSNLIGGRMNGLGGRGYSGTSRRYMNGANGTLAQRDKVPEDLTVEQIEELSEDGDGRQVEAERLKSVSGVNKLIYVTINTEHNLLIVKTSDSAILKSIASLVEQLDRPQTQVMLEMKIIDIKVGEDFSSLFNFEFKDTKLSGDSLKPIILGGAAAFSGGGTLVYEFVSENIKANIELLERNNRINVVSNPMLVASNHRPATLFIGEERVMVRGYSIDAIDNLNTTRTITTPETELEDIGTTLEITPHINSDGSIHIQLRQENSTLNEGAAVIPVTDNNGDVVDLPVDTVSTAFLEGEIFAKHGYTVAVGGLIRDSFSRNRRKVPYLADIPVIGNVFRSTVDEDSKSEMVLLITPYILNQGDTHQQYDPTDKYHKYAPDTAMQSLPVPAPQRPDMPTCGDYCAPDNLRDSDL